jgi:hypothetical protein
MISIEVVKCINEECYWEWQDVVSQCVDLRMEMGKIE